MKPFFSAVVFDMDGLLLDSERTLMYAWLEAAQEIGKPISEEAYPYIIGRNASQSRAWLIEQLKGEHHYELVRKRVDEKIGLEGNRVFPPKAGAIPLLEELKKRGIPCAVASSTHHQEIKRRLKAADIFHYFSTLNGADEVEEGKPNPAVYLLAAKRLGKNPSACIAFEDSENGAIAAIRAGMQVIVVPDMKKPDVPDAKDFFASLNEAIPYLDSWFG